MATGSAGGLLNVLIRNDLILAQKHLLPSPPKNINAHKILQPKQNTNRANAVKTSKIRGCERWQGRLWKRKFDLGGNTGEGGCFYLKKTFGLIVSGGFMSVLKRWTD